MPDLRLSETICAVTPPKNAKACTCESIQSTRRCAHLDDAGSFFVTRAKSNLKARRRYSRPVDRSTGLICDQTVLLTGFYSRQGFDRPLRRIKFNDPQTGKRLVFLTNNFALDALTIAKLYKYRWQVELFFKWIK